MPSFLYYTYKFSHASHPLPLSLSPPFFLASLRTKAPAHEPERVSLIAITQRQKTKAIIESTRVRARRTCASGRTSTIYWVSPA